MKVNEEKKKKRRPHGITNNFLKRRCNILASLFYLSPFYMTPPNDDTLCTVKTHVTIVALVALRNRVGVALAAALPTPQGL